MMKTSVSKFLLIIVLVLAGIGISAPSASAGNCALNLLCGRVYNGAHNGHTILIANTCCGVPPVSGQAALHPGQYSWNIRKPYFNDTDAIYSTVAFDVWKNFPSRTAYKVRLPAKTWIKLSDVDYWEVAD